MENNELAERICKALGFEYGYKCDRIGRRYVVYNEGVYLHKFELDYGMAERIRKNIGERGIRNEFIFALIDEVCSVAEIETSSDVQWLIVNATPEQTALAFMRAIEELGDE